MCCIPMSSFCPVEAFEKFRADLQFFQLKVSQSGFQLWHCTAQGQPDLTSRFMSQVSQPFKVGPLQCLFRTCLVLLGRTGRVRYQHRESSAILSLALLLIGISLLPFKTKNMKTVSSLSEVCFAVFQHRLGLVYYINASY